MATRVVSPDTASSSADVPNIRGINKASPHPEGWTLPHEWNIEKREMFENWKMDVQNQISNVAGMLCHSLRKHPRNDVEEVDYSDEINENEIQKTIVQRERKAGNTLHYGLARVPFPDKY